MDDLIRRSDVLDALCKASEPTFNLSGKPILDVDYVPAVNSIPAVDAVGVVHGKWLKMDMHMGMENYKCSVCRSECYVPEVMGEPMFPLCPYCGARMDGRREEEHNAVD